MAGVIRRNLTLFRAGLEPTGRIGFDWKPDLESSWVDESLLYAFYTRGYKAGGANPPGVANPSGAFLEKSQGAESPRVFKPEYVNAIEIGSKNRLFGGLMTVNANAFLYDYQDYQVSKIVNRSANNENFDAKVWGAELELLLAPTTDTVLNASFGFLKTRIADGEQSINLMDRSQGGGEMFGYPPTESRLRSNTPGTGRSGLCGGAERTG